MSSRVITAQITRPDGTPWAGGAVDFVLQTSTYTSSPSESIPKGSVRAIATASGALTVTLVAGLPVPWRVRMPDGETFAIRVPAGATTTLAALRAAG